MATWEEIQKFARSKVKLSKDEPEFFVIDWVYANKRAQRIVVSRIKTPTREWVEFRSAVCKESEMSPSVALRKNNEFVFGALALMGETYVLRYSVQLATMDPDEFLVPLTALADVADVLESTFAAQDKM